MRSLASAAAAVCVAWLLPCTPGHAAVHWLCGLSGDATQLVCVADPDSEALAPERQASAPPAVVNGTRFPLDPNTVYTVNFWSPATDLAFVEQLARATICYRSPGCEVTFSPRQLQRGVALRETRQR